MNKLTKSLTYAAVAGGISIGLGDVITDYTSKTGEEVNTELELCAQALGNFAMTVAVIHEDCDQPRIKFDYTLVKEVTFGDTPTESESIMYKLPSADEFREQNYVDEAAYNEAEQRNKVALLSFMTLFASGIGGFAGYQVGRIDEAEAGTNLI